MRILTTLVLCSSLLLVVAPATAGDGHCDGKGLLGNKLCCPACNYECQFSVTKTKDEKHCYDVDCKPICIPRVTFPWEKKHCKGKDGDCSPARCAKVKVVKVLEKQTYECSRCKCNWTPVKKGCGGHDKVDDKVVPSDDADLKEVPEPPPLARVFTGATQ